jgi:hypothetical protein
MEGRYDMTKVQFDDDIAGMPRSVANAALVNTSDYVKRLLPSDPKASIYTYGGAIARTLIAFYAGRSVGWAMDVTADEAYMIGGILAVAGVLGWSLVQKKWAAWRTNQAAIASAVASAEATTLRGEPTAVPLEPPPNKI